MSELTLVPWLTVGIQTLGNGFGLSDMGVFTSDDPLWYPIALMCGIAYGCYLINRLCASTKMRGDVLMAVYLVAIAGFAAATIWSRGPYAALILIGIFLGMINFLSSRMGSKPEPFDIVSP